MVTDSQVVLFACYKKGNTQTGILIKITKEKVVLSYLLPPPNVTLSQKIEGFAVNYDEKRNFHAIHVLYDDGNFVVFLLPPSDNWLKTLIKPSNQAKKKSLPSKIVEKEGDVEVYLKSKFNLEVLKGLIPNRIYIDFVERFKLISNMLKNEDISFNPEFLTNFPGGQGNFKGISGGKEQPFPLKNDKGKILIGMTINNKDFVIGGVRIKLNSLEKLNGNDIKLKIFDRQIRLFFNSGNGGKGFGSIQARVFDIGFSEMEIINIYLTEKLDLKIVSESGGKFVSINYI